MDIINFFREDFSEVLGVCHDENKIFLARLTDKIETAEINFEIDLNSTTSAIEQLAEKIKLHCNKTGWKNSKISLILRDGTASTFQTEFKNIPENEIENAIKIWAIAHVGKDARYTSVKNGEEVWMEALPASIVEEYISAFEKNSMKLCALTEIPITEQIKTPPARAIFAVDIAKNKKSPNIITEKFSTWNVKKISLTAMAIFFIAMIIFSAKLSYDYFTASTRAETAQNNFNSQSDIKLLKQELDNATAQIKRFEGIISSQNINLQNFNTLIKIGKIHNDKIILDKITTTGETLEIEGVAESPDAVKLYLNRLKNLVSPQVKLKNSTEDDGQNFFIIAVN